MIIVDVDPVSFDAASKCFGNDIGNGVNSALLRLGSGLVSSGQMAGSDEAGSKWSAQYDPAAQQMVAVIGDLRNANFQIGSLLEQTGFNHGYAESRSDPRGSVPTPADRTLYAANETGVCEPPLAAGGSGSPPTGWGIVEHAVGYVWPNGDTGRLRDAASAWSTAASSLEGLTGYVTEATTAISYQQSPEMDDALTACNSMTGHLNDTAGGCHNLSQACSQLAGYIDTAHQGIENEIKSFIEWTAGIEVAGGLLSVVTGGLSEAGAQGVEASRIAATAAKIAEFIRTLVAAVDTVLDTIGTVVTKIVEVASKLKVILGAKLSEVVASLAARLPALSDDTGAISFGRLVDDADGPGSWVKSTESMSERAALYQKQIAGGEGEVYTVNGVKFDGFDNGLIDAKGPGYAKFVDADGEFKPFFRGSEDLVKQAQRQLRAANGAPITWSIAEPRALEAISHLFEENGITGIILLHVPATG